MTKVPTMLGLQVVGERTREAELKARATLINQIPKEATHVSETWFEKDTDDVFHAYLEYICND